MQWTDWLIVIVIIAVIAILADGLRRKLSERRNRVVMKLDKNIPQDVDPEELPNSELPNGGARTVPREGQPMPSLRTLQARRKLAFKSARIAEDPGVRAVPVLLDAVDVEEERIEHTNVFGDPRAVPPQADAFAADESLGPVREVARGARAPADEIIDGLDEEYEEDAMLAEPEVARKEPGYMETRYQGRRDDDDEDELEDDDEEYEDDEDEEEEEDEEDFDEFEESADEFEEDDEDEDEDEDEDDEDEDEDDYDDEDDDDEEEDDDDDYDDEDEDDEDDDYDDEDEEEEDDEELDELEGLPEDDWGSEEEQDVLVDDYENEPMPLQGAFDKAASQLDKVAAHAATQLDKVASQAATRLDKVASQAASQFDRAATQAASRFKRQPGEDARRIEPGFGDDGLGAEGFDDNAFSEDFSGAWNETSDELDDIGASAPRPAAERPAAPKAAPGKREQGELFGAPERAAAREERKSSRDESRLLAALQKAVPRSASAAEPAPSVAAPMPQEVIIINVMARQGHVLHGGDLLGVLQDQGLRLGDMSIFHRHANTDGSGPVMFSMANMVKPGTFELAAMDAFTTPGVSFFLQMPNKLGNMACFEKMLAAASAVRDAFDAELKDEHRSVFTRQTVEHCRQRVRDFELKLLSRK